MSRISKCPKVTHVLTYWETSGEVSELSYKSLLYFSSNGSYCIMIMQGFWATKEKDICEEKGQTNKHSNGPVPYCLSDPASSLNISPILKELFTSHLRRNISSMLLHIQTAQYCNNLFPRTFLNFGWNFYIPCEALFPSPNMKLHFYSANLLLFYFPKSLEVNSF